MRVATLIAFVILSFALGSSRAGAQPEPKPPKPPPVPSSPIDPSDPSDPGEPDANERGTSGIPEFLLEQALRLRRVEGELVRWSAITDAPIVAPLRADGGRIYAVTNNGVVHAFDAASGREQWKALARGQVRIRPTVIDDELFVATEEGDLVTFDAATGARGRLARLSRPLEQPLLATELYIVAPTAAGHLALLDPVALRSKVREIPVSGVFAVPPILVDGRVIVMTLERLSSIDLETRMPAWTQNVIGGVDRDLRSVRIGAQTAVVVGTRGGRLYAIHAETGRQLWQVSVPGGFEGACTFEERLFVASGSRRLIELDAATGRVRQSNPLGGAPAAAPSASSRGVIVTLIGGRVEVFDERLIRQDVLELGGTFVGDPLALGTDTIVALNQRIVYRLRPYR